MLSMFLCNWQRKIIPSAFLVIGPVDKKDRERFFSKVNSELLAGRIYYIPWIDLSELNSYLDISDICIAPFHKNPQHESGVANKIFDYMLGKKAYNSLGLQASEEPY